MDKIRVLNFNSILANDLNGGAIVNSVFGARHARQEECGDGERVEPARNRTGHRVHGFVKTRLQAGRTLRRNKYMLNQ